MNLTSCSPHCGQVLDHYWTCEAVMMRHRFIAAFFYFRYALKFLCIAEFKKQLTLIFILFLVLSLPAARSLICCQSAKWLPLSPKVLSKNSFHFSLLPLYSPFLDFTKGKKILFSLNSSTYKALSSFLTTLTKKQGFHSKTVHVQISKFIYNFSTIIK